MSDYEDFIGQYSIKDKVETDKGIALNQIDYIFNEDDYLKQIKQYIDSTYNQHYSQNKFQSTDFIVDNGHGVGFTIGNVIKYAQRYGKKGTEEEWRKDLMKIIHYTIIALYVHDNNKG